MPTSAQLLSVVKGSKLWILPKVRTAPTYEVLWLGVFWNSFFMYVKVCQCANVYFGGSAPRTSSQHPAKRRRPCDYESKAAAGE